MIHMYCILRKNPTRGLEWIVMQSTVRFEGKREKQGYCAVTDHKNTFDLTTSRIIYVRCFLIRSHFTHLRYLATILDE